MLDKLGLGEAGADSADEGVPGQLNAPTRCIAAVLLPVALACGAALRPSGQSLGRGEEDMKTICTCWLSETDSLWGK